MMIDRQVVGAIISSKPPGGQTGGVCFLVFQNKKVSVKKRLTEQKKCFGQHFKRGEA
jgi:hypothetical protein